MLLRFIKGIKSRITEAERNYDKANNRWIADFYNTDDLISFLPYLDATDSKTRGKRKSLILLLKELRNWWRNRKKGTIIMSCSFCKRKLTLKRIDLVRIIKNNNWIYAAWTKWKEIKMGKSFKWVCRQSVLCSLY